MSGCAYAQGTGNHYLVLDSDSIERLTVADLAACLALAQDRGWPPEKRKWELLFEVGTCYGCRDEAGELVGTAVLTRYGGGLAAISMVLVANRSERRGIGRSLMSHALAEAADVTVFLNATEQGRPLYEKLGFVAIGTTHTHVGGFAPQTGVDTTGPARSRPARDADLSAILALDAAVTGADRAGLLTRLPRFTEQLRLIEVAEEVTGYAGAWRNIDNVVIGPVIAQTADDAKRLITDLAAEVGGPVRLDLDGRHPQLQQWASRSGVLPRNTTAVMVHGSRSLPGDRSRWFVPLMQALG